MDHMNSMNKYRQEFSRIFSKDIRSYYSPGMMFLGFDIVKFDNDMGTPDGISTKDYIDQKYGKRAVEIIQELLA